MMNNTSQMNTSRDRLALLLAMALAGSVLGQPAVIAPPQADSAQQVSKRQTVDLLLAQALEALKAPPPRAPGRAGKLPSSMEVVAERLQQAAALEPYRADLLFSAANACVFTRDLSKAISLYEKILDIAPDDIDAHSYLAVWQRCKGNQAAADTHMAKLRQRDAGRAQHLEKFFAVIDSVTTMPLRDKLPPQEAKAFTGPIAIVLLGYVLNPDGSMHPLLVQRLNKALELANQLPDAWVVVTGGVPHNNKTEGRVMAQWLVDHGIEPSRICEDNFARTTVENALFSRYALAKHRIKHAVLVSAATHLRRAQAIFTVASWETGPRDLQYVSIGAPDKPLAELEKVSDTELLRIYRDALKAMGLWGFRSYPLEER
jgi:uncharacterized SAM-binding protein YcdF (DUF218 family)